MSEDRYMRAARLMGYGMRKTLLSDYLSFGLKEVPGSVIYVNGEMVELAPITEASLAEEAKLLGVDDDQQPHT